MIPNGQLSEANWNQSQGVLKSLHRSLNMELGGMWMAWNPQILKLLFDTKKYSDELEDFDLALISHWRDLAESSILKWNNLVNSKPFLAEEMDAWDVVEQDVLIDDDDRVIREDISIHVEEMDEI